MSIIISSLQRGLRFVRLTPGYFTSARKFGLFFFRERWFVTPSQIVIANKPRALRFPDEEGTREDFVECFIKNVYGLGQVRDQVRTILDIGANVGFFSLAARAHYASATIHAYEPNPRVVPLLRSNVAELRVDVFPEAVGGRSGYVAIKDEGDSNAAQTHLQRSAMDGIRQIHFQTAIERIGGEVDLLKLDCEGAEWEILQLEECWKTIREVRMEYHLFHGETPDQVVDALARLGFRIHHWGQHFEMNGVVWASRSQDSK